MKIMEELRKYIKENKLPFIQVKNTLMYKTTEMLETSDIYNKKDGKYYDCYVDFDGNLQVATVTMTMTMIDYELLKEHYELVDFLPPSLMPHSELRQPLAVRQWIPATRRSFAEMIPL